MISPLQRGKNLQGVRQSRALGLIYSLHLQVYRPVQNIFVKFPNVFVKFPNVFVELPNVFVQIKPLGQIYSLHFQVCRPDLNFHISQIYSTRRLSLHPVDVLKGLRQI